MSCFTHNRKEAVRSRKGQLEILQEYKKCSNGPITDVLKWSVSHQLVLLSGNLLRISPEKMRQEKESLEVGKLLSCLVVDGIDGIYFLIDCVEMCCL